MLRFEREWEIFVDPGDYIAILFDLSHLSEQTLKEKRRYILLMPGGANDDGENLVNGNGYGEDVDDTFPLRCRCQCQQIQLQNTNANTNSPQV